MEVPSHITAPDGIELKQSEVDTSQIGAWCVRPIAKGTMFGPFVGDTVYAHKDAHKDKSIDYRFAWEVFDLEKNELSHIVNATDAMKGNWMRYVNCARFLEEQNIVSVQDNGQVFYKAIQNVDPEQELLTWFQPFKKRRRRRKNASVDGKSQDAAVSVKTKPQPKVKTPSKAKPVAMASESSTTKSSSSKIMKEATSTESVAASSAMAAKPVTIATGPVSMATTASTGNYIDSPIEILDTKRQRKKKKLFDEEILLTDLVFKKKRRRRSKEEMERDAIEAALNAQTKVKRKRGRKKKSEMMAKEEIPPEFQEDDNERGSREDSPMKASPVLENLEEVEGNTVDSLEKSWTYPAKPVEYQFSLHSHFGITQNGRRVYRCDVCAGVYKHTFSLKRHYLRNHINCRYLSRADITNCMILIGQQQLAILKSNEKDLLEKVDETLSKSCNEDESKDNKRSGIESPDIKQEVTETGSQEVKMDVDNDSSKTADSTIQSRTDSTEQNLHNSQDEPSTALSTEVKIKKEYSTEESPDDEMQTVTDKPLPSMAGLYKCNICYKLFDDVEALKLHTQDHPKVLDVKGFACDRCHMRFTYKQNLVRHQMVHKGETDRPAKSLPTTPVKTKPKPGEKKVPVIGKPFKCPRCPMKFKYTTNLERHEALHFADRSFICSHCGKGFPSATNMKKHEHIHLGSRVPCKYCTAVFVHVGSLRKHIRLEHPDIHRQRLLKLLEKRGKLGTKAARTLQESYHKETTSDFRENLPGSSQVVQRIKIRKEGQFPVREDSDSKFKFSCLICKKRFSAYVNMCRHRRLAHKDDSKIPRIGPSESTVTETLVSSPVKPKRQLSRLRILMGSPKRDEPIVFETANDPIDNSAEANVNFYANVAANIAENLTSYIDGGEDSMAHFKQHIRIKDYDSVFTTVQEEKLEETEKSDVKDDFQWEKFNFPRNYDPKTISDNFVDLTESAPFEKGDKSEQVTDEISNVNKAPALCTRRRTSREGLSSAESSCDGLESGHFRQKEHQHQNETKTEIKTEPKDDKEDKKDDALNDKENNLDDKTGDKEDKINGTEDKLDDKKNDKLDDKKNDKDDTIENSTDEIEDKSDEIEDKSDEIDDISDEIDDISDEKEEKSDDKEDKSDDKENKSDDKEEVTKSVLKLPLLMMSSKASAVKSDQDSENHDIDLCDKNEFSEHVDQRNVARNIEDSLHSCAKQANSDITETSGLSEISSKIEPAQTKEENGDLNNPQRNNVILPDTDSKMSVLDSSVMVKADIVLKEKVSVESKTGGEEPAGNCDVTYVIAEKINGKENNPVTVHKQDQGQEDIADNDSLKIDLGHPLQNDAGCHGNKGSGTVLENVNIGKCTKTNGSETIDTRDDNVGITMDSSASLVISNVVGGTDVAELWCHETLSNSSPDNLNNTVDLNRNNNNTNDLNNINEDGENSGYSSPGVYNPPLSSDSESDLDLSNYGGAVSAAQLIRGLNLAKARQNWQENNNVGSQDDRMISAERIYRSLLKLKEDPDQSPQRSPLHDFDSIAFGNFGKRAYVCSVCKRHFADNEAVLRHQWKKHPLVACHTLEIEDGHDIEYLYYTQPTSVGILGACGKALEKVMERNAYTCTRCSGSFKNIDRLHIHIMNCAPKPAIVSEILGEKLPRKRRRTFPKKFIGMELESTEADQQERDALEQLSRNYIAKLKAQKKIFMGCRKRKLIDVPISEHANDTKMRRRRSYEIGYNPGNHVRRREMTELLDTHQCKGCGVKFKSISLLERHVRKCDGKEKFKDLKVMKSTVNESFHKKHKQTCLYCQRGFAYPKTLMNHYRAFCIVKKDKLIKGTLSEAERITEAEMIVRLKQQDEDRNEAVSVHHMEEVEGHRKGWPKGLKRKSRRKNHCWTYIKKRKSSNDALDNDDDLSETTSQMSSDSPLKSGESSSPKSEPSPSQKSLESLKLSQDSSASSLCKERPRNPIMIKIEPLDDFDSSMTGNSEKETKLEQNNQNNRLCISPNVADVEKQMTGDDSAKGGNKSNITPVDGCKVGQDISGCKLVKYNVDTALPGSDRPMLTLKPMIAGTLSPTKHHRSEGSPPAVAQASDLRSISNKSVYKSPAKKVKKNKLEQGIMSPMCVVKSKPGISSHTAPSPTLLPCKNSGLESSAINSVSGQQATSPAMVQEDAVVTKSPAKKPGKKSVGIMQITKENSTVSKKQNSTDLSFSDAKGKNSPNKSKGITSAAKLLPTIVEKRAPVVLNCPVISRTVGKEVSPKKTRKIKKSESSMEIMATSQQKHSPDSSTASVKSEVQRESAAPGKQKSGKDEVMQKVSVDSVHGKTQANKSKKDSSAISTKPKPPSEEKRDSLHKSAKLNNGFEQKANDGLSGTNDTTRSELIKSEAPRKSSSSESSAEYVADKGKVLCKMERVKKGSEEFIIKNNKDVNTSHSKPQKVTFHRGSEELVVSLPNSVISSVLSSTLKTKQKLVNMTGAKSDGNKELRETTVSCEEDKTANTNNQSETLGTENRKIAPKMSKILMGSGKTSNAWWPGRKSQIPQEGGGLVKMDCPAAATAITGHVTPQHEDGKEQNISLVKKPIVTQSEENIRREAIVKSPKKQQKLTLKQQKLTLKQQKLTQSENDSQETPRETMDAIKEGPTKTLRLKKGDDFFDIELPSYPPANSPPVNKLVGLGDQHQPKQQKSENISQETTETVDSRSVKEGPTRMLRLKTGNDFIDVEIPDYTHKNSRPVNTLSGRLKDQMTRLGEAPRSSTLSVNKTQGLKAKNTTSSTVINVPQIQTVDATVKSPRKRRKTVPKMDVLLPEAAKCVQNSARLSLSPDKMTHDHASKFDVPKVNVSTDKVSTDKVTKVTMSIDKVAKVEGSTDKASNNKITKVEVSKVKVPADKASKINDLNGTVDEFDTLAPMNNLLQLACIATDVLKCVVASSDEEDKLHCESVPKHSTPQTVAPDSSHINKKMSNRASISEASKVPSVSMSVKPMKSNSKETTTKLDVSGSRTGLTVMPMSVRPVKSSPRKKRVSRSPMKLATREELLNKCGLTPHTDMFTNTAPVKGDNPGLATKGDHSKLPT